MIAVAGATYRDFIKGAVAALRVEFATLYVAGDIVIYALHKISSFSQFARRAFKLFAES